MEVSDIRQKALRNAMEQKCDGKQATLGKMIGKQPDYISRMLSTSHRRKGIGNQYAREIEQKLGLPPMWLDQEQNAASAAIVPAASTDLATVPMLEHRHYARAHDFIGVPLFLLQIQAARRELKNLRVAALADAGMMCAAGQRQYLAVIDIGVRTPTDGDIYLVEHGNKLKLRRMMFTGGHWTGRSDMDPGRYPDVVIDNPDEQVVGQLVWGGGWFVW